MTIPRLFALLCATTGACSILGCGSASPTSPPGAGGEQGATTKGPSDPALAAALGQRAQFSTSSLASDRLAGSIRINQEVVSFEVRVTPHGTVRAEFDDTEGRAVVATIQSDGRRAVHYDGQRIVVSSDGVVSADAFAGLSRPMHVALGLVPLDLACAGASAGGDARLMEAIALPFNLLQRAEPAGVGPHDLVPAASCMQSRVNASPGLSELQLLGLSKLVVKT
jgi:hypothetical protein